MVKLAKKVLDDSVWKMLCLACFTVIGVLIGVVWRDINVDIAAAAESAGAVAAKHAESLERTARLEVKVEYVVEEIRRIREELSRGSVHTSRSIR